MLLISIGAIAVVTAAGLAVLFKKVDSKEKKEKHPSDYERPDWMDRDDLTSHL